MFYSVASLSVVDSSFNLYSRCCVLSLRICAKESLVPLAFLGTCGSRVAALLLSTPLKLSLDLLVSCSNKSCYWSVEPSELILCLDHRKVVSYGGDSSF